MSKRSKTLFIVFFVSKKLSYFSKKFSSCQKMSSFEESREESFLLSLTTPIGGRPIECLTPDSLPFIGADQVNIINIG